MDGGVLLLKGNGEKNDSFNPFWEHYVMNTSLKSGLVRECNT